MERCGRPRGGQVQRVEERDAGMNSTEHVKARLAAEQGRGRGRSAVALLL